MTWTDAEISKDLNDQSVVGNKPRRQADFIYTIIPEFQMDQIVAGLVLQGTTDFYLQDNNDLKQEGLHPGQPVRKLDITEDLTWRTSTSTT